MASGWLCHDGHSWCYSTFPRLIAYFPSENAAKEGLLLLAAKGGGGVTGIPMRLVTATEEQVDLALCRLALSRFVQGAQPDPLATLAGVADALTVGVDWASLERKRAGL